MKQEEEKSVGLPDNAFRPLKPGEQYHPIFFKQKTAYEIVIGDWSSDVCSSDLWRYYSRRPQLTWD